MTESQPTRGRCWLWDHRSPRWRWKLARGRVMRDPLYPEDETVRAARAYVRWATGSYYDRRYRPYFPTVKSAIDLRIDRPALKAEVEAHLLVGRTPEYIGERVNRPPEQIDAYEQLFFDVRDRLDDTRWLEWYVVDAHAPVGPYDLGKLWKYFAFLGGECGLDMVLEDFRLSGRPDDYAYLLDGPPEPGREEGRALVQLAILERILPMTDPDVSKRLLTVLAGRSPVPYASHPQSAAAERISLTASRAVCDLDAVQIKLQPIPSPARRAYRAVRRSLGDSHIVSVRATG